MRTRSLAALVVAVSSLFALPAAAFATPLNLRDVPAGDPDRMAIEFLNRHEVVYGSVDGMFHPDANITRGEILKIALEASGEGRAALLTSSDGSGRFSDVPVTHTLGSYIAYASGHGYISGYTDGTFRPDANVSRAEASKIVANVLHVADTTAVGPYSDVGTSSLKPFIERLAAANWYRPSPPLFNPNIPLARREMAQMTYRALVAASAGLGGDGAPKAFDATMVAPMTAASDWQTVKLDATSVSIPAGWMHNEVPITKNGVTLNVLAAGPFDDGSPDAQPTFVFVSVDAQAANDAFAGTSTNPGDYSPPVIRQIAVDGMAGLQTIQVVESRDNAKHVTMDVWAHGTQLYFAYYAEDATPGLRGTFDRFIQHAVEATGAGADSLPQATAL
jgi:hypothetical protein